MSMFRSGEALVVKLGSDWILDDSTYRKVVDELATIPNPFPSRLLLDVSEVSRVTDTCFWAVTAIALLQTRSRRADIALAFVGSRDVVEKLELCRLDRELSVYSDLGEALLKQAKWKTQQNDPEPRAVPQPSPTVKRCPTCGQRV